MRAFLRLAAEVLRGADAAVSLRGMRSWPPQVPVGQPAAALLRGPIIFRGAASPTAGHDIAAIGRVLRPSASSNMWPPACRFACSTRGVGLFASPVFQHAGGIRFQSTAAVAAEQVTWAVTGSGLVRGGDAARRQVGWWLAGASAWVFSLVILGGVTRLTKSGLSMTDWKFLGTLPPMTESEWEAEFGQYRRSPEYQRVHSGISLADFQFIFWMEYTHRMWGRALGIAVLLPGAYFAARGYLTPGLAARMTALFAAGGGQAFVGWWMVRSGLEEPPTEHAVPRVSPYRLATHLGVAFAIYTGLLWTTLQVMFPVAPSALPPEALRAGRVLRMAARPLAALVGITALSGAFVAGLDAGRAYNTFPLMGGQLIPAEYWSGVEPTWRNAFENVAAAQLHHRALAVATLVAAGGVFARARGLPALARPAKAAAHGVLAVAACQVGLGIWTLLAAVPVTLGSLHQAGALTLFSATVVLLHVLP